MSYPIVCTHDANTIEMAVSLEIDKDIIYYDKCERRYIKYMIVAWTPVLFSMCVCLGVWVPVFFVISYVLSSDFFKYVDIDR